MIVRELIAKFGLKLDDKSFKAADNAVDELKESARHLIEAFALFEGVKALGNLVKDTLETADVMSKAAEKIGITTEELERLRYAGDLAGISAEQMDHALTLFTKKVADAAGGNTEAVKSFASLGIKIHDANGKIRSADELLDSVADKMKEAKSKTERLGIAMDLFGQRGGSAFVALLKDGREGLDATKAELGELGAEFSGQFGRDAEDFNDNLTRVGYVWKGLKNTLAEALLPTLAKAALAFLAWTKANQQLVRVKIIDFVRGFIRFGGLAAGVAGTFARALMTMVDAIGGVRNALIVLGAAFTLFTIVKIGEAVAAFTTFTAAFTLAKAAMIADAALTGAAFLILGGIIGLVSEEVVSNFSNTDGIFNKLSGHWGDLTKTLIGSAYDAGVSWQGFFDLVFAGFSGEIAIVDNAMAFTLDRISDVWDLLKTSFEGWGTILDDDLEAINAIVSALKQFFSFGTVGKVVDFLNSPVNFGGSVGPSAAAAAAGQSSGATIGGASVSVHVDASGQSLDEGQLATILTDRIHSTLTTINAQTLNALTPSAVRP